MNELNKISERLHTQDNRITMNPMFCVQEKHVIYGMDPQWTDNPVWIDTEDGCKEVEAPEDEEETDNIIKTGKKEIWWTVMVSFTEEGAKEYLRLDGHNLGETRIYVESFNRCPEMIAIRDYLMSLKKDAVLAHEELKKE